ncbi:MAG: sigma-70 family RNA polymerase sigma factor [Tepidisphaeraceae bacterium]
MNPHTTTTATKTTAATATETDELIDRIRGGDQRACEQLVREHGPRMLAVARRFFRNEEDAADAVQDAFASAFGALDRFAGKSQLGTWLHRIVVNACLMRLRREKHEESIEPLLPTFQADGHHAAAVKPWTDDVIESAQRSELRDQVRRCIDQLPASYRTVLLLRDIEEFDTAETARLLECSENNVKVRLHRARQALRSLLEPMMRS